jgi:hypothetical protein
MSGRPVEVLDIVALPEQRGDRFVARAGFDPRALAARLHGSEAKENQTYCTRLVRSNQATPTETAKAPR